MHIAISHRTDPRMQHVSFAWYIHVYDHIFIWMMTVEVCYSGSRIHFFICKPRTPSSFVLVSFLAFLPRSFVCDSLRMCLSCIPAILLSQGVSYRLLCHFYVALCCESLCSCCQYLRAQKWFVSCSIVVLKGWRKTLVIYFHHCVCCLHVLTKIILMSFWCCPCFNCCIVDQILPQSKHVILSVPHFRDLKESNRCGAFWLTM